MDSVIASLTAFVDSLHPLLQVFGVAAVGFIPFLESETAAFIGVLVGMPFLLALVGAVAGNLVAVGIALRLGDATARGIGRRRGPSSERRKKVIARVDRWGVPLAALIAPTVMAMSITTYVMVAAGLDRRQVFLWHVVAVVGWGLLFALIGLGLRAAVVA